MSIVHLLYVLVSIAYTTRCTALIIYYPGSSEIQSSAKEYMPSKSRKKIANSSFILKPFPNGIGEFEKECEFCKKLFLKHNLDRHQKLYCKAKFSNQELQSFKANLQKKKSIARKGERRVHTLRGKKNLRKACNTEIYKPDFGVSKG